MVEPRANLKKYDGEIIEHVLPRGTYVLATKYNDGDPGDAWGVGYYLESFYFEGEKERMRHRVIGSDGEYLYGPKGFIKVRAGLTPDVGHWLVENCAVLEHSPPGSINLWTMLTGLAFGMRGDELTGAAGSLQDETGQ